MNENPYALLEGLIFMSGEEGLSLLQIQSAMPSWSRAQLEEMLKELQADCRSEKRGIELTQYAGRWKYLTKELVYPAAKGLFEQFKTVSLSSAAMETLAIIAYRQPITRVEIEEIRGVGCDMMLKKLLARGLIEAKDRKDVVGKPLLYTVTDAFLDAFELTSLQDLPVLEEKKVSEDLFDRQ